MTSNDLNNTIESQYFLQAYVNLGIFNDANKQINRQDFSINQLYIIDCFILFSSLLETASELENITIFLNRFDKKYFINKGISQSYYIQYHLQTYVSKLFTITELFLLLTNQIYNFNLTPKKCNFTNIIKKTENQHLKTLLINIFQNLKTWRSVRNASVHHNVFKKSDYFEMLSAEEFLWTIADKLNEKLDVDFVNIRPKSFVDFFIKQERHKKVNFIKENNEVINDYIYLYLKCVINDFKVNINEDSKSPF